MHAMTTYWYMYPRFIFTPAVLSPLSQAHFFNLGIRADPFKQVLDSLPRVQLKELEGIL